MDNHKVIISGKHYSILLPFKMDHIIIPEFKQVEKRLLVLCLTLVLMGRIKNQKNVVERKKPNKCSTTVLLSPWSTAPEKADLESKPRGLKSVRFARETPL